MWRFLQFQGSDEEGRALHVSDWQIQTGEAWAAVGERDAPLECLPIALEGGFPNESGMAQRQGRVVCISFSRQQALYEQELREDDSDLMDRPDIGTRVRDFLADAEGNLPEDWLRRFGLNHLLDQGLRFLSTGETRKVLIVQALMSQPDLLILDEPCTGLDSDSRQVLYDSLLSLKQQGLSLLLLSRRPDLLPDWLDGLSYWQGNRLAFHSPWQSARTRPEWQHLLHFQQQALPVLPADDPLTPTPALAANEPLILLDKISIRYGDKPVLRDFSWRVEPGEHWRISGPNGSGKSTLLSVITGEHPQCYSNAVRVFGYRRGSGESLWDIRRHFGLVSGRLHRDYRVSANAQSVVLSGLFDSIGVYQPVNPSQEKLALQWLAVFRLESRARHSFHALSHGEQRLVLIARALIKRPQLLILDEPCEGLDAISRQMVLALVNRLAESGECTLLYVSHDDDDLPAIRRQLRLPVR